MDKLLNQPGITYTGSLVYFVIAHEVGMIKIGYSTNLIDRLNTLQTACPVELAIMHTVPGSFMNEHELHVKFSALRRRGEWFLAKRELLDFIDRLKSGEEKLPHSPQDMREPQGKILQLEPEDDETFPETMMPASLSGISKNGLSHVNADFPYFVIEDWDKKAIAKAYWYLVKRNPLWMVNMPGYEWERFHPDLADQLNDTEDVA